MIWKIWKKSKSNSDKIWTTTIFFISFNNFLPYFPNLITIQLIFHIFHIISLFSFVFSKCFHYSTCPSLINWIVIRFGKYRIKLWKDMKIMEEK
jgi:hypothetical protein